MGTIENVGSAGKLMSGKPIESEKLGRLGSDGIGMLIGTIEKVGSAGRLMSGRPIESENDGSEGRDGSGIVTGITRKSVKLHALKEAPQTR